MKQVRLFLIVFLIAASIHSYAQPQEPVKFSQRNLGGPRLGITYVYAKGEFKNELNRINVGPLVSQFGWHFEYQIVPETPGPSFVIQFIPLVGGVEYGKLIPGASLAFGIRFPGGFEFGMGPNVLTSEEKVSTALVLAFGKSFDYGGVSIPINIAFTTNPDGQRISFIFGYAIDK